MEKMMDPNIIDYYIINCAIPLIMTIENLYRIDFGRPKCTVLVLTKDKVQIRWNDMPD